MERKIRLAACAMVLFSLVQFAECAQMIRGYESRIGWNPNNPHLLMRTRDENRKQRFRIDFYGQKMRKVPSIMVSPNIYDWEWGNPTAWTLEVKQVDQTGFFFEITAHFAKHIYTIFFNWIAIVDEGSLQVKYYTLKTPNLEQRKPEETFRINFDYEHEQTPLVWTTFMGLSFIEGPSWQIYQNVENIDTQGFTYKLNTNGESKLPWVKIGVFSIDPDRAYLIHGDNYLSSERKQFNNGLVYESYVIKEQYTKKGNEPQTFSCVKGFNVGAGRNMRLQSQRDEYYPAQFQQVIRLGKWADTELKELQYTQFIYVPSVDRCAKFYSECSFQGEELFQICEGAEDNAIATELHGFDVRSIQVPKGIKATIFEKENFEGTKKEFEKDQPCIKEWKW